MLTKINPVTYPVAEVREVMLSRTDPNQATEIIEPFAMHIFGYRMGPWEDVLVTAWFGAVLLVAATWSVSHQE